tara:strand:- start:314 stop:460 length:147 start_codon:yes stop_codon:yes gene_type:complete
MDYLSGWKMAQAHYEKGLQPRATRGCPKAFKNGYSDGYFAAQKVEKTW